MGGDRLLGGAHDHALRASLTREMHIRKLPPLAAPVQVLQMLVTLNDHDPGAVARHLALVTDEPLPDDLRYRRLQVRGLELIFERHTEFASYTFIASGPADSTFSLAPFEVLGPDWFASAPGQVIRATRLALVPQAQAPDAAELATLFAADSLVCCDVADGAARLYSDFMLHPEGCGRLLLVDQGLQGVEPAQLVRRVQELGNYRKMALLGLPVAQGGFAQLDGLEGRLSALTARIAEESADSAALLSELSTLSAELAALIVATRYRMSASAAYGRLVQDRLESLKVRPVRGYPTLADFTDRRLSPALRTCASFQERLDDLAGRAEWSSALLRTRIETAVAAQNRDLLASMDRRASAQLRLQQTVEGLSVVAISYYALGLFNYAAKPLTHLAPGLSPEWLTAAAVPVIVAGVWLGLRRLRRHWAEAD